MSIQAHQTLKISNINTPLGTMIAIADEEYLYFLDFVDKPTIDQKIETFRSNISCTLSSGITNVIKSIDNELKDYFKGCLIHFNTKLYVFGTPFQKMAWHALQQIPYGHTRSYLDQATAIGNKHAYRAVANANGANRIAIVIPCHRIINNNGDLGGYGSGIQRKKWLLDHEQQYRMTHNNTLE